MLKHLVLTMRYSLPDDLVRKMARAEGRLLKANICDSCKRTTAGHYNTADSHSLEEAQFKTLRSACSLKPESQIENRIRCVTLGLPLPSP